MGANTRHLLRGLSSLRSLLLPLLGESSHGGGSRTVPLHGATSGSSVRHVVCKPEIIPLLLLRSVPALFPSPRVCSLRAETGQLLRNL